MGNCLERALSDEEDILGNQSSGDDTQSSSNSQLNINQTSVSSAQRRPRSHHHRHNHHHHHNNSNRSSTSGLSALAVPINQRNLNNSNFMHSFSMPSSTNRLVVPNNNIELSSSLQEYNSLNQQPADVYYLTPNVQRTADQLTEEDQIKLLKRMALIQQLPAGSFDDTKKNKE
jgi:hypothetical protein